MISSPVILKDALNIVTLVKVVTASPSPMASPDHPSKNQPTAMIGPFAIRSSMAV
jgi:hypothetical protein